MTSPIDISPEGIVELGAAARPRRLYHHVLNGGTLTPEDVSRMVKIIERQEAEIARLRAENERLEATLSAHDTRRKGGV